MAVEEDAGIGQVKDLRGRPVVDFQLENLGRRIPIGKGENVGKMSPSEGVDGLRVVPHDHEVPMLLGQQVDDVGLDTIGVLILIHQDVAELFSISGSHLGMILKQGLPVEEEIVKIQAIEFLLPLPVVPGHGPNVVQQIVEIGKPLPHYVFQRPLGIYGKPHHILQNLSPGEMGPLGIQPEFVDTGLHEALSIFLVQDGVIRLETHERGVAAEDSVADVMKSSPPNPAADPHGRRHEEFNPPEHLPGGLVGEGNQKDVGWVDSGFEEIGHSVGHHPGFTAPRSGDD
jgi:hypothetical protein